jgi:hypothetical protein
MKCFFFGHKFGKVDEKGYQYCSVCGVAAIPSPCASGHSWVEDSRLGYSGYYNTFGGGVDWKDWKICYRCKNCGETKVDWLFGH